MLSRIDITRSRSVVGWAVVFGLAAGLVAAGYFSIAGEPAVDDAIAIEEAEAAAAEAAHDEAGAGDRAPEDEHDDGAEVSRNTQKGVGLFAGYALFGGAFGLVLAVTAMALRGEWLDPFRRFVVAGAILAGAYTVVPWFKYPPNPPAVGNPDTAGERQLKYWLLIILAGVILAGAAHLSGRLRRADWDPAHRIATVALAAVVALGVVLVAMPANTEPVDVPATLVWRFRTASLVGNLLLWSLLTVGFGWACAAAAARRRVDAGSEPAVDQNSMPFSADTPSS